jgi:outer membrane lipoprotein SlyB
MRLKLTSKLTIGLTISSITLTGCMVALEQIAHAQFAQNSLPRYSSAYCENFARDYANRKVSGQPLSKAGEGAALGALIGGIASGWSGARTGAAVGAGVGAVGGGVRQSSERDRLYKSAYEDCLRGYLQR